MPLFDFECNHCGYRHEALVVHGDQPRPDICPACKMGFTTRIFTCSGHACENQAPAWLRDTLAVVDKSDSATVADREFVANPTRSTYQQWLKARKLRPMEPGEKPIKRVEPNMDGLRQQLLERHRKRMRIEIGSR